MSGPYNAEAFALKAREGLLVLASALFKAGDRRARFVPNRLGAPYVLDGLGNEARFSFKCDEAGPRLVPKVRFAFNGYVKEGESAFRYLFPAG